MSADPQSEDTGNWGCSCPAGDSQGPKRPRPRRNRDAPWGRPQPQALLTCLGRIRMQGQGAHFTARKSLGETH